MKRKFSKKVIGFITISTAVCILFVSATLAKYTQTVKGSDTARVAKFAYTVKDQANNLFSKESVAQLALFETTNTNVLDVSGNQKLIAPGTTGTFTITVANTSEVNIEDSFALVYTNVGKVPVYFTYNGKNYSDVLITNGVNIIDGKMDDLAIAMTAATTQIPMLTGTQDYAITWTWDFTGKYTTQTDATDTALGEKAIPDTISLEIDTTLTQIN